MTKTLTKLSALGFVLFTTTLTPVAKASEWDKKTIITTHQTLRIQGKVLEPGQYVLKLLDSPSDRNILQIYNVSETKVEMTILANSAYRQEPTDDSRFTFAETQTGQPRALRTWFYPGENYGLAFSTAR